MLNHWYSFKIFQEAVARTAFTQFIWQNPNGNRNAWYLYWNDERWCLNYNWLKNDFNSNYRLVASRNFLYFSHLLMGFLFYFNDLIHPPSILPISFIFSERETYFLLSSDFTSHETCKKNFNKSNFVEARFKQISFSILSA